MVLSHSCDEHCKPDVDVMRTMADASPEKLVHPSALAANNEVTYKEFTMEKLMTHMRTECPKKLKFCPLCREEFFSYDKCREHLRDDCPFVQITCDTCEQVFTREEFAKHECYLKIQGFKEVIEAKDEERIALIAENDRLAAEIDDTKDATEREGAEQQDEIMRLE